MLKSIGNNFINSSLKVKIQLYILPLFLIYFYIYFFTENREEYIDNNNSSLNGLLNKKFNKSYLKIINEIENYCNLEKIKIISMNYKNKNLLIKGESTLLKIRNLIEEIENINKYSNIILVDVLSTKKSKKSESYSFEIKTEFKKYYIKKKVNKENKTKIVKKKKNKNNFKLKAVVSDYVLINNMWYELNDKIGKYKIINIKEKSVILNYKENNMNLKLYKDE